MVPPLLSPFCLSFVLDIYDPLFFFFFFMCHSFCTPRFLFLFHQDRTPLTARASVIWFDVLGGLTLLRSIVALVPPLNLFPRPLFPLSPSRETPFVSMDSSLVRPPPSCFLPHLHTPTAAEPTLKGYLTLFLPAVVPKHFLNAVRVPCRKTQMWPPSLRFFLSSFLKYSSLIAFHP